MGGGVVRNRFRQARYDKLKAALIVQRAKQPPLVKCDSDSDDSVPGLAISGSESGMLPGDNDGDPEFSDSDSSSDEVEHAPSAKVLPRADLTVQKGGTPNTHGIQPTLAPPGAGRPVQQDGALSSTVEDVQKEQDTATVLAVKDSAHFYCSRRS